MAKKPSERRNYEDEDMELNLTPMMNLISLLIPCLLISMVFVEIATINVTAPAIGSASDGDPPEKPDKPPLNLVVTITDKGYHIGHVWWRSCRVWLQLKVAKRQVQPSR